MNLKDTIRTIPDFPKPGIMYRDITTLLTNRRAVAYELGAGFVPIRKKGKLPFETYEQDYQLEYGTDTIEVHADSIRKGENILIIARRNAKARENGRACDKSC